MQSPEAEAEKQALDQLESLDHKVALDDKTGDWSQLKRVASKAEDYEKHLGL